MHRRIVLVHHNDDPYDDRVSTWLNLNGIEAVHRKPFAGDSLDENINEVDGLVLYGGPQNAFAVDEHPHLRDEYELLDQCLTAGRPVVGFCLGAQQIAHHLGARVGPLESEQHEFGYYCVEPTENAGDFLTEPTWFTQAHFHTFDLPAGARHLARNDSFEIQAFQVGSNVFGLQYHPEQTIEGFRRWQNGVWAMYDKPGSQTREEQTALMMRHDQAQADWFYGFLHRVFGA